MSDEQSPAPAPAPQPAPTPAPPPAGFKPDYVSLGLVGLLLVTAVFLGWQEMSGDDGLLPTGSMAPNFMVPRPSGENVQLADLRGRVVVLDFWATWCPPCREEMPWLVKLGADLEPKGVSFVAASQDDQDEQVSEVAAYVRELPGLASFVAYSNPTVGAAYKVQALPSLFVIDAQGRVVYSKAGLAQESAVRQAVEQALSAK